MELGFVGLGKMGMNMVERLRRDNHRIVAFDLEKPKLAEVSTFGALGVATLSEMVAKLEPPRLIWVMLPAGEPTESTVLELGALLQADDTIVDGGNSNFKDDARRAADLGTRGIHYLDVGTSGGVWGLKNGYCLMVGGEEQIFRRYEPIFATLAPPNGYDRVGGNGAGHYAKMVHNGIEYAMMQAYAEGFESLHESGYGFDLGAMARLWGRGSVVRSWMLELAEIVLARDPELRRIRGYVEDSGEGRWAVIDAIERGIATPATALALFARFRSRAGHGAAGTFSEKLLAALRDQFGGHGVMKE
ncbi:MAG TPA: decarboxylating 6-phosphogluconate dehydrogenase [Candidatus Binataceae bacterium]|nr:decarboxylating 6-phosphogluconate dehydrogenase [Candidatus Binataceae bacterium]